MLALLLTAAALTEAQAQARVPRADLAGLTDEQRGAFVEVAHDVLDYAGCQDTLEKCLAKVEKDPHALRMAELLKHALQDGVPAKDAPRVLEEYYASFDRRSRQTLRADNCAVLGKGPVTIVEFSDYQCPHCAAALAPLHELVTKTAAGKARLCSKFFPFPSHPRARVAALCAAYAKTKGRFWQLNELLFAHQDALEDENLKDYAKQAGLDGDDMLKEAYAGKFDEIVEKQRREGLIAGVDHTPMLYVNGRALGLPPKPFYLRFTVEDELEWAKKRAWTFEHRTKRT